MEQNFDSAIDVFSKQANLICRGNYEHIDEIYQLEDPTKYSESIINFVEAFGMMAVKLEAREFQLERTIEELKEKNDLLEESIHMRNHLNFVFMNTVVMLSFFSFILALLKSSSDSLNKDTTAFFISRFIEVLTLVSSILLIVKSKLPLTEFGLTLKNWSISIKESLIATVLVLFSFTLIKMVLIYFNLIEQTYLLRLSNIGWSFSFYILVAPLQEFLSRGVVQGTLQRIVTGKNGWIMAIILTSIVFGTLHLYISTSFAIASILGSFIWGWLYIRHKTIVGVSISHFIIGLWLGLLGFLI